MREIRFRAWDGTDMIYDYQMFTFFHDQLICEGDTIALQFTGLQDKYSREIIEGDIVNLNGINSFVEYRDGAFVLRSPRINPTPNLADVLNLIPLEIVGNIYQNPELLNGNKG